MGARRFAVVHDPRAAWPQDRAVQRLRSALDDEGREVLVRRAGPLTVAWVDGPGGPALLRDDGDALCVVDGVLDSPAGELLAALAAGGATAALEVLRGEACVVWWDRRGGLVLRDHLGARTAVWTTTAEGVVLAASHERQLLDLLGRTPAPDRAALAAFLASRGQPIQRTLLEGVHRLPGGWALELDDGVRAREAWRPRYVRPEAVSFEAAVERVAAALQTSVRRRVAAAGPERTAVMLSGGVDSSSVAAFAARRLGEGERVQRALAAGFPDHPGTDESERIRTVASALGLRLELLEVRRSGLVAGAVAYARRWRLPPLSPNVGFWPLLLGHARDEGIEVVLDGEGGDEVFAAPTLLLADLVRRGRVRELRRLLDRAPSRNEQGLTRASRRHVVRTIALPGALPAVVDRVRGDAAPPPPFLRPDAAALLRSAAPPWAWKRRGGPRWWAHQVDITITGAAPAMGADHIARRAAGSGVLSRHPLQDLDVLRTLQALDPTLHFDRRSRPLLRAAVSGLVPDDVRLRRDKSPFDSAFHAALEDDLPVVRQLLDADALVGDVVDVAAARVALLDPGVPPAGPQRTQWAVWVWRLVAAEIWLLALAGDARLDRVAAAARPVAAGWAPAHP